jgi:hypothetical protein
MRDVRDRSTEDPKAVASRDPLHLLKSTNSVQISQLWPGSVGTIVARSISEGCSAFREISASTQYFKIWFDFAD